ncbi:hypothetical protein [Allocoleopsis sp.]|uniref:hypothetical protein n=1 Tax=Allocoleopsis sp. TaxID=3088169 RepID=UPI002FD3E76C
MLSCTIFLLAVSYQIGAPTETSRWVDEIYKIKVSIANSIKTPKLVVVAGSNVLFGMSCQMIDEATGVPCVNAGTYAGLGLDYILNRAHSLAKPGDIILLSLEYGLYQDNGGPSAQLIDYVFSRDPKYLLALDFRRKTYFISWISYDRLALGMAAKLKTPQPIAGGYESKNLNKYGDETSNVKSNITEIKKQMIEQAKPIEADVDVITVYSQQSISNFIKWCRNQQIKVLVTWPGTMWFESYKEKKKQEYFKRLEYFYRKERVPVLGKPTDFMYNKSMFYDTSYHLNEQGVQQRTGKIINFLQPYLRINARE